MFGKKKSVSKMVEKAVNDAIGYGVKPDGTKVTIEKSKPAEEWIWVNGYKGTDKNMQCLGYQYELQKCFDISDEKEVKKCEHGFHLCKDLNDVYGYYDVGNGNRFFEVKALVRKDDYESYTNGLNWTISHGMVYPCSSNDKLVAKSIIFTRELTVDEIVKHLNVDDWSEDDKKMILEIGYNETLGVVHIRELVKLGYSEAFAKIIANSGKFDVAQAVGTQKDLSMDMKVWVIFNDK